MNNKKVILIGFGVLILVVVSLVLSNKGLKNNSTQNLQNSIKNEISVGSDICTQFSKDWVTSVFAKPIIKTTTLDSNNTHSCQYNTDENNFITLRLNNLSVQNQKKGQIALGRTITTNSKISMEHFIVLQEDGIINGIYLIINPNLFLTVDRNSIKAASQDEILNFAVKVAQRIQNKENIFDQNRSTSVNQDSSAPLPQAKDTVSNFFNLINENKISDAVNMLSPSTISNESSKQAWGVQFNAFEKITVKQIESATQPAGANTYKVTLDVKMKPGTQNVQPIPYYGWGNGEFVRWITLENVNGLWKITGIATGP